MYKLGVLLLICGALGQHHVTQQVQPASERQIRLDDIERDGLKTAAASQAAATAYQQPQQQLTSFQQPPSAAYQQPQLAAAAAYQTPAALHPHLQQHQPFYQLSPAAYHQSQLSYSPQLLGGHPQQLLQPLILPQSHPYNVPIMLIPYPLQQELTLLPKVRPLQHQPQPQVLTKFRPSPQVQYTNPYSSQTYQQKFASGVKSTPAPTLKESYDQQQQQQQQQSAYNYKLQ